MEGEFVGVAGGVVAGGEDVGPFVGVEKGVPFQRG